MHCCRKDGLLLTTGSRMKPHAVGEKYTTVGDLAVTKLFRFFLRANFSVQSPGVQAAQTSSLESISTGVAAPAGGSLASHLVFWVMNGFQAHY